MVVLKNDWAMNMIVVVVVVVVVEEPHSGNGVVAVNLLFETVLWVLAMVVSCGYLHSVSEASNTFCCSLPQNFVVRHGGWWLDTPPVADLSYCIGFVAC